jgi:hypothetical protein
MGWYGKEISEGRRRGFVPPITVQGGTAPGRQGGWRTSGRDEGIANDGLLDTGEIGAEGDMKVAPSGRSAA